MRTFILHYLDGHTEQVEAPSPLEATQNKSHLSYYEEPEREIQKEKLLRFPDKEVQIAIVPRGIKVPSASKPGESYDVIVLPNGNLYCPCTGFANRHYCWHTNYVHELLEEEKKNAQN